MTAALRAHWAFARMAFLQILQYRLRYVTGILTYLVYVTAYAALWKGIYGGAQTLKGFSAGEMVHFVALGWIFRSFYYNNVDREVAAEVREGKIGTQLLRPVSYPVAKLVAALGESAFRLLFFTLPIAVVVGLVFGVPAPWEDLGQGLRWRVSVDRRTVDPVAITRAVLGRCPVADLSIVPTPIEEIIRRIYLDKGKLAP